MKKKIFVVSLLGLLSILAVAQENEAVEIDSTWMEEEYYEDEVSQEDDEGVSDSLHVTKRSFDEEQYAELKNDPALQYKEAPTIAESLWDRFLLWLSELFESMFSSAVHTNWGRVFSYILGVAVVVVIIMMILKVDAFKVFYSGQGASTMNYTVFDENIHEMDFEAEIQRAVNQKDYRRGVRLVFLYSLKMLSDKHLINWDQGKTNHDYVAELKTGELKTGLNELSYYFDYAWYGNFAVTSELFNKVNGIFHEWKGKLK